MTTLKVNRNIIEFSDSELTDLEKLKACFDDIGVEYEFAIEKRPQGDSHLEIRGGNYSYFRFQFDGSDDGKYLGCAESGT